MSMTTSIEALRSALEQTDPCAILPALAAATGDLSLLEEDLRPSDAVFADPPGGYEEERLARVRELAIRGLEHLANGSAHPVTSDEDLLRIMSWLVPDPDLRAHVGLYLQEAGLRDLRTPSWNAPELNDGAPFRVVIIGAGMSGIVAGHRFLQAGCTVTVFEKDSAIGGTWLENAYPGCRVDVANHLYAYSFGERRNWPNTQSTRAELLEYFQAIASSTGVAAHIHCSTAVTALSYDESTKTWNVTVRGPEGERTVVADVVISSVGQLNHPKLPQLPGMDRFQGPSFHTARWREDVDLSGKRVAVVGTGSTGIQVISEIAKVAKSVTIFERTPTWVVPVLEYKAPVAEGQRLLFDFIPGYLGWHRLWLLWKNCEGLLALARVDENFDGGDASVSPANAEFRALLEMAIQMFLPERDDLVEMVTPAYPPIARRLSPDDGSYFATLMMETTTLIHGAVEEVTETGLIDDQGTHHEVDVIVWATGFQAQDFLLPMPVIGRDGVTLAEIWQQDPLAYLGICVPNFPNLFFTYGPNTNIVINGSIIYFSELEVDWIQRVVAHTLRRGDKVVEPTSAALDAWRNFVDVGNDRMAWGVSSVPSWYRSASGRITQNWPESLLVYFDMTKELDETALKFA
jgi:4-hydroxyacetophenone monooxygenase